MAGGEQRTVNIWALHYGRWATTATKLGGADELRCLMHISTSEVSEGVRPCVLVWLSRLKNQFSGIISKRSNSFNYRPANMIHCSIKRFWCLYRYVQIVLTKMSSYNTFPRTISIYELSFNCVRYNHTYYIQFLHHIKLFINPRRKSRPPQYNYFKNYITKYLSSAHNSTNCYATVIPERRTKIS